MKAIEPKDYEEGSVLGRLAYDISEPKVTHIDTNLHAAALVLAGALLGVGFAGIIFAIL